MTLTEILVVLGIIVFLAICLIAASKQVSASILRGRCSMNLRALATAMHLYCQDHNQVLPAREEPAYGELRGIWFEYGKLLLPYLGEHAEEKARAGGVFTCPLNATANVETPSYIFNSGNQFDPNFPGLAGVRINTVAKPSRTLLFYEIAAVFPASWHAPLREGNGVHDKAKNMACFVDGRVAFLPFYWDGQNLSVSSDPPEEYGYQLSPD